MFRTTQKEKIFFELFSKTINISLQAAEKLLDLVTNYENVHEKIKNIETIEHECDQVVHSILEHVNKSFITPIDREDISLIATELDNITDFIESTVHRFSMFDIKSIRPETIDLANVILKSVKELCLIIGELENMKKPNTIKSRIIEVNRLENEGDLIFRNAVTKLFCDKCDAFELIKWKEIFEILEHTIDACEDIANTIEGVVMKNV